MHHHDQQGTHYGPAFALGIGLNMLFVGVEGYYGLRIHSSALLADAGHNFSDVISLLLAWVAAWMAGKQSGPRFTYGFRKTTILASLINGLLIIGASGLILYDAIQKFQHPVEIPGNTMMVVAAIGMVVNTGTALLFLKGRHQDLNIKGAFLHMAADAGVTLAVLIGGIVMQFTGAYWVDPALSILIVGVILYSAIGLLAEAVRLVMDAVPRDIDLESVRTFLLDRENVQDVHDLHIWSLSTTEVALTAHLVIPKGCTDQFLFELRDALQQQFGIDHSTFQVEHTFEDEAYRQCH